MPAERVPVSKPSAELKEVYRYNAINRDNALVIGYHTKYGKLFEREEGNGRGVVWYQVTQT